MIQLSPDKKAAKLSFHDGTRNFEIEVEYIGYVFRRGENYEYRISADGIYLEIGSDLWSPAHQIDVQSTVLSLVSFLLACLESDDEASDNFNLFPPKVRHQADYWQSDLALIQAIYEITDDQEV